MIISVTGCSTWRRVFISMKIELAVLIEELDGAGAAIFELSIAAATVSPILWRSSALRAGEGASSQIFWWRRCSEQSRSPR